MSTHRPALVPSLGSAVLSQRSSGVLLHLTSLPGPHGSGDLGAPAYQFVDWLVSAGQSCWQILPLSPVGPGFSPYHSPSTFAGNPLLVDLEELQHCGWLPPAPAPDFAPDFAAGVCDFERVAPYRLQRLRQAWQGFVQEASVADRQALDFFRASQAHWLEGYALFMALQARHGQPWTQWPAALRQGDLAALAEAGQQCQDALAFYSFIQWRFMLQWARLHAYAQARGIALLGDAPIFVAHHSADVWQNPELFCLDDQGEPTWVAGVPPDHYSASGQRWGNPLYRWDVMAQDGFAWWRARLAHLMKQVNVLRLDHFRGFESYWSIPAHEPTAEHGHWCPGPGLSLFEALADEARQQGRSDAWPLVAEDLGFITPAVTTLRQQLGMAGMRVMQFAFGDSAHNPYLPHNFEAHTVAYTGTHDNDTSVGWWQQLPEPQRARVRAYLGPQVDSEIHWALMQSLSQSVATLVVLPLQDVLGLDGAHRMNVPGQAEGCWRWRFDWPQLRADATLRLREMTRAHGRNLSMLD